MIRTVAPWIAMTVSILVAAPAPAASETEPLDLPVLEGVLTARGAVEAAIANNRELLRTLEERGVARGRVLESYAEALPRVSIDGNYERLAERPGFEIDDPASGTTTVQSFGEIATSKVELNVSQPVYRGGQVSSALRAARFFRQITDENVREAVLDTVFEALRAYYAVLLASEQHEVAKKFEALSETQLADTRTRRKFGVSSDFNVLRAEVDVANARAQTIRYRNALSRARSALLRVLGVSQDSDVRVDGSLPFVAIDVEEDEALRTALASRPDLEAATLGVRLQDEAVRYARSDYFPKIDAYFTETLSKPDPAIVNVDDWGDTWRAGVNVTFTLFDGFRRKGRIAQERAILRQREIERVDVEERARYEIRDAVLAVRDAEEAVEVQRKTVEQANEGLRLADVGYREGTLDQVSVLEARAALTQAQFFYFESLYRHNVARLVLERAKGTLDPTFAAAAAGS